MSKKIIYLVVLMLSITLTGVSAVRSFEITNGGAYIRSKDCNTTDLFGTIYVRGIVLFPHEFENNVTFFAIIFPHVNDSGVTNYYIFLKWVRITDCYIVSIKTGPLDNVGFIQVFFNGEIEIID